MAERSKTKRIQRSYKEKTLEAAIVCMSERGYVVIGLKPFVDERYKVGQVISECCAAKLDQPLMVVAETDHADWVAQCRFVEKRLGYPMGSINANEKGSSYYRVVTD